jgi:phage shock protein C
MINYFRQLIEKRVFGVCQWLGGKLSIQSSKIRMFFIYASFLTIGSPLILYLIMAFILENKSHFKGFRKKRVWDL